MPKGEDGRPIGQGHSNPSIDTCCYQVDLNGIPHEFTANAIAENIFSQVDSEGRQQLILCEMIDHRKNEKVAIPSEQGTTTTKGGQQRPIITTKGWELKLQWADGTSSWLPLCEVKNTNKVEMAEYAIVARINQEPAFKWWVPRTLKKRHAIIAKVRSQYWHTTHKFGIKLPHSVEEAYKLDEKNKNDFWHRAIEKEMALVHNAFERCWLGVPGKKPRRN